MNLCPNAIARHLQRTGRRLHYAILMPATWAKVRARLNRADASWCCVPYLSPSGVVQGHCVFADSPLGVPGEDSVPGADAGYTILTHCWSILKRHAAADGSPSWCDPDAPVCPSPA